MTRAAGASRWSRTSSTFPAGSVTWCGRRVDRDAPVLDSLVGVYPGASWHEREVHEMFGVTFAGNPDLRPLLTTGDAGHPLRRTTPLPARVATPWPGAVEPSDRPAGDRVAARPRSRPGPPGVPSEWQT